VLERQAAHLAGGELLVPEGWFDADLITVPVATLPLIAAYIAVVRPNPPDLHFHHDDQIAPAIVDFLALSVAVCALLKLAKR
jgi:hypothetical protein